MTSSATQEKNARELVIRDRGISVLHSPFTNRGSAFSLDERDAQRRMRSGAYLSMQQQRKLGQVSKPNRPSSRGVRAGPFAKRSCVECLDPTTFR